MNIRSILKSFLITSTLFASSLSGVAQSYNEGINIIPQVESLELLDGDGFTLTAQTSIAARGEEATTIANFFLSKISQATGFENRLTNGRGEITFSIDSRIETKAEGYTISVDSKKINVVGRDAAGLFYGMQSLLQLFPAQIISPQRVEGVEWSAPALSISDSPRFGYRGVMLDVCRHFMPVDFVKKQIDILSMFKVNRMHWHLTEDQAWRVEIKKYPLLTQVGATRIEGEGFEYSGYYTQEEIKEVVAYAAERHITIIPEFELPGHELAAIAAYPELSCKGEPITPRIIWGVEDIVMCPAKDITFQFIEDVIAELAPLFPGEYFHVGGDECPKRSWQNCERCQDLIKKEGLEAHDGHSAEERLQSYVIQRAEKILAEHGKTLIGWDEILEGGLSPSAIVMSWRGETGGIAAARQGNKVIMSPQSEGMYLNFYQGDNRIEPVTIGGDVPLSLTYAYNPIPDELEGDERECIMGVQANLWSEYMYNTSLVEYQLYPRACALAEVAWSQVERKDYEDFSRRINNAYVRLDSYDVNYHIPQPEQPNGSINHIAFVDAAEVEFTTTRPIEMVYTLDGSEPTPDSTPYESPLKFTKSGVLKIRSLLPSGVMSPVRTITLLQQPYAAATKVDEEQLESGLHMTMIPGYYLNTEALERASAPIQTKEIKELKEMVISRTYQSSIREVQQAAHIAEGYIEIPEDGVYHLWTNHAQLWINGELLICNDDQVKRFSRNSSSVALAKGLHPIKIVWLGNIIGGWPSNWDSGDIMIREQNSPKAKKITGEYLKYTPKR
ncbi:MAG: family 20 glycosylhydrolase [Rikenellaceae bacterium]